MPAQAIWLGRVFFAQILNANDSHLGTILIWDLSRRSALRQCESSVSQLKYALRRSVKVR